MPYYMRENHANRTPRHHVVFDTETYPTDEPALPGAHAHKLHTGVARRFVLRGDAQHARQTTTFSTRREFWAWLYSQAAPRTLTWIWSHNAAFDLTTVGLWEEIDSGRLAIKGSIDASPANRNGAAVAPDSSPSLVTAGPPFLCDCVSPSGASFRFIDSLNWAFLSLAKIGPMLNLPKLEMPGEEGSDDDWRAYCLRDVDILEALVLRICRMVKRLDLGNMQWTLGSQAMSHYRHRHAPSGLLIGPDEQHRPLERRGYYAARQEVYYRGDTKQATGKVVAGDQPGDDAGLFARRHPVYRIDANSCYPYVMSRELYPTRPFRRLHNPAVKRLRGYLHHFIGAALVRLWSQTEPYPQRRDGRTTWRIGRVDTVLVGPELLRAVELGHVQSCDYLQLYRSGYIFADWFQSTQSWLDQARDRGDDLEALLIKRMRNSLHGKFGQTGRSWRILPGLIAPDRWGEYTHRAGSDEPLRRRRGVAGLVQEMQTDPDARGASPIIAACVTAYAREHMRGARQVAGERSVYYEDADSLHVSAEGLARLTEAGMIHPTRPGAFKVEETADFAEYYGVKNYRFGERRVISGRSDRGGYDQKGVWHQTEWLSLDNLLSRSMPKAPITLDRQVGEPESYPSCGYGSDGWIQYPPGV